MEELPKNGNVIFKSAIKAGYSESYAHSNGKHILKTAIKETAKDIIRSVDTKEITAGEAKELMCEIMGIDKGLLLNTLKKIALQDKDYSSALKVLNPLAKQAIGLDITNSEDKDITKPVLNIGIIQNTNTGEDTNEGSITTL